MLHTLCKQEIEPIYDLTNYVIIENHIQEIDQELGFIKNLVSFILPVIDGDVSETVICYKNQFRYDSWYDRRTTQSDFTTITYSQKLNYELDVYHKHICDVDFVSYYNIMINRQG